MTGRLRASRPDRSGGAPPAATATERGLPDGVRARMEAAFGADFSDVRVREDDATAAIDAAAFTQGSSIAFTPGVWNPDTRDGREALGHELAHVLQQRAGRVSGNGVTEDPALEAEADAAGDRAARGESAAAVLGGPVAAPAVVPAAAGPVQPGRFGDLFRGLLGRGPREQPEESPYQPIPMDVGRRGTVYSPITSPEDASVIDRFKAESPYQNIPTIAELQALHESPYANIPTGLQAPPLPTGPKPPVLPPKHRGQ